jgi:hypothetical protein
MNGGERRDILPLALIPVGLIVSLAVLNIAYFFAGEPMVSVSLISKFGFDFRDYHWAARRLAQGMDPWKLGRFVTPPLTALVAMPLAALPAKLAVNVFFFINIAAILSGSNLLVRAMNLGEDERAAKAFMLASVLFSYPVYFLLHRGNFDGLVYFFLSLGLFFASTARPNVFSWKEIFAGISFAIAAHLKIYPLLILLPILATRRWRLALAFAAGLAILFAFTFNLWESFYEKMAIRQNVFSDFENGSVIQAITATVQFPAMALFRRLAFSDFVSLKTTAYGIYFLLLSALWAMDIRNHKNERCIPFAALAAAYIPFMVVVPDTAFVYEYIHLLAFIPLGFVLARTSAGSGLWLFAIGVFLTQAQSLSTYLLTQNQIALYIPAVGALWLIVVVVVLKIRKLL